jgi:hypothetical protein
MPPCEQGGRDKILAAMKNGGPLAPSGKKAAKDKISGEKKGKGSEGGSKSGVDKAEKALKNRLK